MVSQHSKKIIKIERPEANKEAQPKMPIGDAPKPNTNTNKITTIFSSVVNKYCY